MYRCGLFIVCVGLALIGCDGPNPRGGSSGPSSVGQSHRPGVPASVSLSIPRIPNLVRPEFLQQKVHAMWPAQGDSMGYVLHALHMLHEWTGPVPEGKPSIEEMELLYTDSEKAKAWFGTTAIIRSRDGLRYITPHISSAKLLSIQPHVDQALALLGELGKKSSEVVRDADGGRFSIEDLLKDCRANLRLEGEIEWSTLALAIYHPSRKGWQNRFQEEISFDKIAMHLVQKDLSYSSCFGIHALHTLTVYSRLSETTPVLSPKVKAIVDTYLDLAVATVIQTQRENGALNPHWYRSMLETQGHSDLVQKHRLQIVRLPAGPWSVSELIDRATPMDFALSTGHHCEWMFLLQPERQPPPKFFGRCGEYLAGWVEQSEISYLRSNVCPATHSLRILIALSATDS